MTTSQTSNAGLALPNSENEVAQRGKAIQGSTTSTVRQVLGDINQSNASRAQKQDEKKMSRSQAASNLKVPILKLVNIRQPPAAGLPPTDELAPQPAEGVNPGQYNPLDIIEAPPRPADVRDIDMDDHGNPQLLSEYISEIYVYLRRLERSQAVRANYMEGYAITSRMRTILIDWLIQVHQRFRLLQETLYLTVAIIDRFLQEEEVSKSKLQLVGVTAMWIASKYEEMYAPEINDFVYITDNSYTRANIRQMERIMLKKLHFNLGRPLPLHFLRRYSKAAAVDSLSHMLAKYLLELSLMDYNMVHYHPSEVSAASLCLTVTLLEQEEGTSEWDETMEFCSTYSKEHLQPIMDRLAYLVLRSSSSKQKAIKVKYQSSKFMRISTLEELDSPILHDWAKRAVAAAP